jgi:hypothetical protein
MRQYTQIPTDQFPGRAVGNEGKYSKPRKHCTRNNSHRSNYCQRDWSPLMTRIRELHEWALRGGKP